MTYHNLSKVIKNRRVRLGMSQRELATKANVSTGLIGIVERGHWTLGVDVLAQIAEALDTTAVRLLSSAARMRDEQRMD